MSSLIETSSAPAADAQWPEAIRLLEQATRAGFNDQQALYLLAISYKHANRFAEARQVLSKITDPDSAVLLQRGILAFHDKDYAKAAEEFGAAWMKDDASYAAAYNVVLSRMYAGQLDLCRDILPRVIPLAPDSDKRLLTLLRALLLTMVSAGEVPSTEALEAPLVLNNMTTEDETRLLDLFAGLGKFEISYQLLSKLVAARPTSTPAFAVYFGAVLVQAKQFLEKNQWDDAKILLAPVRRRIEQYRLNLDPFYLIALYQMLGTCYCMVQEFDQGIAWFRLAHEICTREFANSSEERRARFYNSQGVPQIAWIEQNLALATEWQGKGAQSEQHWARYVDILEQNQSRSRPSDYIGILAFECLSRLADQTLKKEQWPAALAHLQRAHKLRPSDYDTLERLFNLYTQLKRPDEARRILKRMREARPHDPQVELFELDVREVRSLEEVEKILGDLRRINQKFPGDMRVDERARTTMFNLFPVLERFADQFTGQVNKVVDQMRRLPSYQVNWPVVRDVMRDMEEQFTELRRVAHRMMTQSTSDDLRRDLQRLIGHCDRKIDQCRTLTR